MSLEENCQNGRTPQDKARMQYGLTPNGFEIR
jgi:hypothetical protein